MMIANEFDREYSSDEPVKKKRPGFFKRWIYKMAEEAWEYRNKNAIHKFNGTATAIKTLPISSSNIDQPDRAIHFTVYNATGGRVVETRRYNTKTDRSASGLYVITSDQKFGNEIDKIITMEALKQ